MIHKSDNMGEEKPPLYFENQGSGSPAILIHGLAASLRQWDYLIPELAEAGFSAYAPDLPGHGNSPKPEVAEHYHIEVLAEQINDWIENLELVEPAMLVGHSLGGYLSLIYALRHPEKVRALVLIDPLYSPFQLSPAIRYFVRKPGLGIRVLDGLPAWLLGLVVQVNQKSKKTLPDPILHRLVMDYKRTTPRTLFITRTIRDLTPQLSRVSHPSLVVWGGRDLTLSPASFPKFVASLPKAESYTFPGCGHIPHLTQYTLFNQLVLDFVTSKTLPN